MKFKQGTRRLPLEYERELVRYWKDQHTFEKSIEQRSSSNSYVFYDGPPFITGVPHVGTLLSSVVKDAIPRYFTMKGKHIERRWGWDCHGLPAEVFTEKKLGIKDKRDVGTKISLEEYIKTCRNNMVQTGNEWEEIIDRIGRWVDFKGAYKTMDKDYMESVWWAFKKMYEAGKIYEGEKVLLYCTRDATPISKAEVAMDNSYQEDTDPSVYVKFKLVDEDVYLLAWTTTPWTLPANTAVALNQAENYAEVDVNGQRLILARNLLAKVLTDAQHNVVAYTLKRTLKGKELVGKHYEPLFENRGEKAHRIWHADYVSLEEGTGIVHLAPAYGEEDYQLAKEKDFPIVSNVDDNGFYNSGEWQGQQVWEVNKLIAKVLFERGVIWKIDYITHSYPHCHRCGTRLMYRAHPSWFLNVSDQRAKMLELNGNINWFPQHIKHGRFAKTVQAAPDWNISRDRFWATAMPVWKGKDNEGKDRIKVIGSYAELKELSGVELEDYHRPWIDKVMFTINGVEYKRIDKVLDCWLESGSMPFAQFHYPFENTEKFEKNFPGDFIAEYVGQVRAWFYYLHTVSTALFDKNAFTNVIVTGTIAGNDGRKMSKQFGNYTDPSQLMDEYSADALRYLLLSSPLLNGEDFSLIDKDVADVSRKLNMIWNMYDFFTLYADVDSWEWGGSLEDPHTDLSHPLDQWIVSRIHQLNQEVDQHMQSYDIPSALKPVMEFINDASNWYVRRSRKRFWKSQNDSDKQLAYQTLHYTLVQLAIILAPFTPFLAEELYRKLTGGESVHLLDWPETGRINSLVLDHMRVTREVITLGLAQRAEVGIKVRQPLQRAVIENAFASGETTKVYEPYLEIIRDELNVKEVVIANADSGEANKKVEVSLDTQLTPELKREGMIRELIRHIQNARKQAGLEVSDRIRLSIVGDDQNLVEAIKEHQRTIIDETLTAELTDDQLANTYEVIVKIDRGPVYIRLVKVTT